MSELPKGWSIAPLAALVGREGEFADGDWIESKDQDPGGPIRLLQLADIGDGIFLDKSRRFINEATFERLRCTEVFEGDVLIARMPDPLGRASLAPKLSQRCITVVDVAILRPGADSVNPQWAMRFLNSPQIRAWIELESSGTTRKRIARGKLAEMELPVPPLSEQKRIANKLEAVLSRVDACRARLARVPGLLKRFRQSVLAAATSGRLTEDFREGDLSGEDVGPRKPNATNEAGEWGFDGLPVTWRWLDFSAIFEDLTDSKRKLPQNEYELTGDFPVIDQGEKPIGGYTSRRDLISLAAPPIVIFGDHTRCVKWVDTPFVQGADGVKVLVPNSSNVFARYAYLALLATRLPDKGYSRHMKFLRATYFPVPPLLEQKEIVRRVENLFAFADRIEARLSGVKTIIDRLTPATLSKAFRGELVPQDLDDEPASALLERIKQQQRSLVTTGRPAKRRIGVPTPRAPKQKSIMTKSRFDEDVKGKAYLAGLLRNAKAPMNAETLFKLSELPLVDFYKQLAWEIQKGHIRDHRTKLEAAS